jgi:holo-[acyl-carrier protein] synthase
MILRTGVDFLEIERLRETAERHGEHFMARIFTPAELAECRHNYQSLAARFAAKEAVSKA